MPVFLIVVFTTTELRYCIVFICFDGTVGNTTEHIGHKVWFEELLDGNDCFQNLHHAILSFERLTRMQTVIASVAIIFSVFFAKIMQELLTAAHGRLGVRYCLEKQMTANLLFSHRLALHKLL